MFPEILKTLFLFVIFTSFINAQVYTGSTPFPAFHRDPDRFKKIDNFINYIHPNLSTINGKLYNSGNEEIGFGAILCVSYPILTHINHTKDLIDQIIDIYSHQNQYNSIINYLHNKTSKINNKLSQDNLTDLIISKFGKKFNEYYINKKKITKISHETINNVLLYFINSNKPNQQQFQAIYQYFDEISINKTHNNANSFINKFGPSNIFSILNPVITYAIKSIEPNELIQHNITITKDPPTSDKSKRLKLIEGLFAKSVDDPDFALRLVTKLIVPEYLTALEKLKLYIKDTTIEMVLLTHFLELFSSFAFVKEYCQFLAENYHANLIGFGDIFMKKPDVPDASIYYKFISKFTGKFRHWKEKVKVLWIKKQFSDIMEFMHYALHVSRENFENRITDDPFKISTNSINIDTDIIYLLCSTLFGYRNAEDKTRLFSEQYMKWIKHKKYYNILMDLIEFHQMKRDTNESIVTGNEQFSALTQLHCFIAILKMNKNYDKVLDLFVNYIWNINWTLFDASIYIHNNWLNEDYTTRNKLSYKLIELGDKTNNIKYYIICTLMDYPLTMFNDLYPKLKNKTFPQALMDIGKFYQSNNQIDIYLYYVFRSIKSIQMENNNTNELLNNKNYKDAISMYVSYAVFEANNIQLFQDLLFIFPPKIRVTIFEEIARELGHNGYYIVDLYANIPGTFDDYVIDLNQKENKVLENIALKYLEYNITSKALNYFGYSIESNHTDFGYYVKYLRILNEMGEYKEVIKVFDDWIEPLISKRLFSNETTANIYNEFSDACDCRGQFALKTAVELLLA